MLGFVMAAVIGAGLAYFLADYAFAQYRGRLGPDIYVLVKVFAGGIIAVTLWAIAQKSKR